MREDNITLNKRKKVRIDICTIRDFKEASLKEGYRLKEIEDNNLKKEIIEVFNVDEKVADKLHSFIKDEEHTFRADNINSFIDYIEKIVLFEDNHKKLCRQIKGIKRLHIDREEYEREPSIQDDVDEIINIIETLKPKISSVIDKSGIDKIYNIEKELSKYYVYAKDIELLKRMISNKNDKIFENYNVQKRVKTLSIDIPKELNKDYIKATKGTVEYHQHLNKALF